MAESQEKNQDHATPGNQCSFCNRDSSGWKKIIVGKNGVSICNECVIIVLETMMTQSGDAELDALRNTVMGQAERIHQLENDLTLSDLKILKISEIVTKEGTP